MIGAEQCVGERALPTGESPSSWDSRPGVPLTFGAPEPRSCRCDRWWPRLALEVDQPWALVMTVTRFAGEATDGLIASVAIMVGCFTCCVEVRRSYDLEGRINHLSGHGGASGA